MALEFSPNGMWLAIGTTIGSCQVWDLLTDSIIHQVSSPEETPSAVRSISWNVSNATLLISYLGGLISQWSIKDRTHLKIHQAVSFVAAFYHKDSIIVVDGNCVQRYGVEGEEREKFEAENPFSAVAYNPSGILLLGNSLGEVSLLNCSDFTIIATQSNLGSSIEKIFCHPTKWPLVLMIMKDRSVRFFTLSESKDHLEQQQKFLDVINRAPFISAGFTHDGEFAFGSIKQKSTHTICLWELVNGSILQQLEGPHDELVDVRWHPRRPVVASISKSGKCYVWRPNYPKKWSALFANMQEVEENVEYIEREDEFDEVPDEEQKEEVFMDEDIDLVTIDGLVSPDDIKEVHLFTDKQQ